MTDADAKQIVQAAARLLVDAILNELQDDPHSWSERPCSTCRSISSIIGHPFGCYQYAAQRQAARTVDREITEAAK